MGRPIEGLVVTRADWMSQAACRDMGTDVFFALRGKRVGEARLICAACPVKAECRDYAVRNNIEVGVWGSTTESDRRRLRREQADVVEARRLAQFEWLVSRGWKHHEIAREFGMSERGVCRALKRNRDRK